MVKLIERGYSEHVVRSMHATQYPPPMLLPNRIANFALPEIDEAWAAYDQTMVISNGDRELADRAYQQRLEKHFQEVRAKGKKSLDKPR